MAHCKDPEVQIACFRPSDGSKSVVINHTILFDKDGKPYATYFSDRSGAVIDESAYLGGGVASLGECAESTLECVESQEWTYGIDNTGTSYLEDNTIKVGLSDGTSFTFNQPPTTGWTPQMALWGASIQQAADDAGLAWFVDTRYRNPADPSNLSGGGGFSGPASLVISNALVGMEWRYVNIQICPSQPVPVSAVIVASSNPARVGFNLTTAGAVKGPLQRFFVCRQCGEEPKWYLSDGETEAEQGQIPSCYEPCGVLSQLPPPPENNCQFEITEGCDNNNSTDSVDFTVGVTRRASVCNGNEISTDFFRADPLDANALVSYTMNGVFVDCSSGEPIAEPLPDCAETTYVGKLYQIDGDVEVGTNIDWWAPIAFPSGGSAAPHGNVSSIFSNNGSTLSHANGAPDVSFTSPTFSTATSSASFLASVGAANSAGTSGTDQLRLSGYIVLKSPAVLRDTNPNTGERGAIYVNKCCAGDLELLFERTTDTLGGQVGVFEGVKLPAGIHYVEAVTSDISSWQGLELSVSFDDGATYEPFVSYTTKPAYTCVPVIRCEVTGILLKAETGDPIVSGPFDSWCEPKGCPDCCVTPAPEVFDGNVVDVTPNPDQTHAVVSGLNTSIPAGFKSVTINSLTGTTTINGGFQLGGGRRVTSISYGATEADRARGLLPVFTLTGGTWQWTAISPIAEV